MPKYKLYCLDRDGRISGAAEPIEAPTDDAAVAIARALDRGRCEIWQGDRLVGTIPSAPPAGGRPA